MSCVHIVASASAWGCLTEALRQGKLNGKIFSPCDDYSLGPLKDGVLRGQFWKQCFAGNYDESPADHDPLKRWDDLHRLLESGICSRIVIWLSESASDHIFFRMTCRQLAANHTPLLQVVVPLSSDGKNCSVAYYSPEELVQFLPLATFVTSKTRAIFAAEFEQIVARPELLRTYCSSSSPTLRYLDISGYDDRVLAECTSHWQVAVRVVGNTLKKLESRSGGRDDAFIYSRLLRLIDDRRVEADAQSNDMGSYRVRTL